MSWQASRASSSGRTAPSSSTASSSSTARAIKGRASSPKKASTSTSTSLLSSPVLNADLLESQGLLDGDESGLLSTAGEVGRGLEDLTLDDDVGKPRRSMQARRSQTTVKQRGGRPSWGPKSSPVKGKIRLLDGLHDEESPQRRVTKQERTLGAMSYGGVKGAQKARQSIFARPQQQKAETSPTVRRSRSSHGGGEDGEDSFYKDSGLAASSSSVRIRTSTYGRDKSSPVKALRESAKNLSSGAGEQLDSQLVEVKRMNAVFEAYEQMLLDSSGQLDDFSTRIHETNALLDSYIDLMRQTDRTYQLLMDSEWQGVTEDESAHALAMELAEREERRRQEQAEEEARQAAKRAQEAEMARLAATMVKDHQQQRRGVSDRPGMRSSTVPSSVRGSARAGSGIPTRGVPSTASTRGRVAAPSAAGNRIASSASNRTVSGASSVARSTSGASGLNNRYEGVRSSGYGPR